MLWLSVTSNWCQLESTSVKRDIQSKWVWIFLRTLFIGKLKRNTVAFERFNLLFLLFAIDFSNFLFQLPSFVPAMF